MFNKKNTSYILCKERISNFENHIEIGEYKFQYNNNNIYTREKNKKRIIIFGRFVNSHDYRQTSEEIINNLIESQDLKDLIKRSKKLAGRFIIIYFSNNKGIFVIPDASASIHVAYTVYGNDLFVSSNPKLIADINGWEESLLSQKIKSRADHTHPLPYDMSMYDQIKFVIPNHYLDCEKRTIERYYPLSKINKISSEMAAKLSTQLLKNIIMGYHNRYKLSIPLTSGIDSRTILSICKNIINDIPIYTFFHDNFTETTPDIWVPKKIAEHYGLEYTILKDNELPDSIIKIFKNEFGSSINRHEARNAWTYYNSKLRNYTRLDGNIIPLAKSSFGRNLPELFATSSYLVTKTHNYAEENKKEVERWIKDFNLLSKHSDLSKFDLFFWEHRVGKWTSNSLMNADLLINSLNPFNCRELIETWLMVPRKERMNEEIHKKIIKLNWPDLLEFPINPNRKGNIFYKNSILFYFGSRFKYLLDRNKF